MDITSYEPVSEEAVSFDELSINTTSRQASTAGVYGSFETCGTVQMKPGWNILNLTGIPANLNSVSIWMTEGNSIARGGFATTASVQIDRPNKLVRIKYHWSWKSARKAGAQCFWSFS